MLLALWTTAIDIRHSPEALWVIAQTVAPAIPAHLQSLIWSLQGLSNSSRPKISGPLIATSPSSRHCHFSTSCDDLNTSRGRSSIYIS